MRLEISNPSDKATIDCTNLLAAHLAVVLLASGRFGIIDDDGEHGMPIFLFGGHDEFFQNKHGKALKDAFYSCGYKEVAKALKSIELVGERSSLNDFTSRAHELADELISMADSAGGGE